MTKDILIALCLGSLNFVFGQNLVDNPGFELAKGDSTEQINTHNNFTCDKWNSPSKGTPDYYTSKRKGPYSAPDNRFGKRKPHSGEAYAGIAVNYNDLDEYEYLQIKLNQKLIKDNYYCLSLYINQADNSVTHAEYQNFSTNELDYTLSSKKQHYGTAGLIKLYDYGKIISPKKSFEPNSWNYISTYYKAKGEEEFLIIGIFNEKYKRVNLTKFKSPDYNGMYFYIDDVSLTPLKDTNEFKRNEMEAIENTADNYDLAVDRPIILKNINFETNTVKLLPGSFNELNKLANYLKSNLSFKIEITGHTDNVGKEDENLELSKARAESVAGYLTNIGIVKNRISFKGLGSRAPIKPNDTEENRRLNRRVEFKIIK